MKAKDAWLITKQAVKDFFKDDAMTLSAALAFYAALSLAPLVALMLWVSSSLGKETQDRIVQQAVTIVGPGAGEGIRDLIKNAQETPNAGTVAGIIGIVTLVLAATGVFGQLQRALNLIWDVEANGGVLSIVLKRLTSLLMVMGIWVLLVVSVVLSTTVSAMGKSMEHLLPGGEILWHAVAFIVPLLVFVPVFALLFKYVPDVRIRWRDVWVGAAVTALLFVIGKVGLGIYLGRGGTTSAYGAAGALMALLLWVYYSSLIIFFGAEITQCWARYAGTPITPAKDAHWLGRDKAIGRPKHDEAFPRGRPRPA